MDGRKDTLGSIIEEKAVDADGPGGEYVVQVIPSPDVKCPPSVEGDVLLDGLCDTYERTYPLNCNVSGVEKILCLMFKVYGCGCQMSWGIPRPYNT